MAANRSLASGRILKLLAFAGVTVCLLFLLVVQHNIRSELSETQEKLEKVTEDKKDLVLKLRDEHDVRGLVENERKKITQELSAARTDHNKAVQNFHNEIDTLKAQNTRVTRENQESATTTKTELSKCLEQKQQLDQENSKHVGVLTTDLREAKEKLDECSKSKKDLEGTLTSQQSSVKTSKARFDSLEKELQYCKAKQTALKAQLSTAEDEVSSIREELLKCGDGQPQTKPDFKKPEPSKPPGGLTKNQGQGAAKVDTVKSDAKPNHNVTNVGGSDSSDEDEVLHHKGLENSDDGDVDQIDDGDNQNDEDYENHSYQDENVGDDEQEDNSDTPGRFDPVA